MMSKASFMMQDQLRHSYSLITDIFPPNSFIVRGRLPFPQGLAAIAVLFSQKYPADVYAHPYFVEKQSDPNQPSPQLHITEESQGIMKVMGGLRYMRDDNSKLDNTMFVVTDYEVGAKGRMLSLERGSQTVSETDSERYGDQAKIHEKARQRAEEMMRAQSGGSLGSTVDVADTSFDRQKGSLLGRTSFPTPEDSSSNPRVNMQFFQRIIDSARTGASSTPGVAGREHGAAWAPAFPMREGGYTVLYNPIETNEKTFIGLIRKLEKEERVVKAIVVPTRQAWRHIQLWADAFPDAAIVSSGEIPIAARTDAKQDGAALKSAGTEAPAGGIQDFGNGVTGLSFPEVDLEAVAAEDARYQQALAEKRDEKKAGKRRTTEAKSRETASKRQAAYEDPVDVLLDGSIQLADPTGHAFVGLRADDAGRVRVLRQEAVAELHDAPTPATTVHHMVRLTPRIELHHVEGDAIADEYVLYDVHSGTLACTDLYHGPYADLDPVNSWMCRVWFKFMKAGNHKRTDIVPRFKWLQVCRQGTLTQMQAFVHRLTTTRPIWSLIYAHGTPPQVTDAASELRVQWGLPPLTREQREKVLWNGRPQPYQPRSAPAGQVDQDGTEMDDTTASAQPAPPVTPPRFAVGDQLAGAQLKEE